MTHPTLLFAHTHLRSQSAPQQTTRLQNVEGYYERPQKHHREMVQLGDLDRICYNAYGLHLASLHRRRLGFME